MCHTFWSSREMWQKRERSHYWSTLLLLLCVCHQIAEVDISSPFYTGVICSRHTIDKSLEQRFYYMYLEINFTARLNKYSCIFPAYKRGIPLLDILRCWQRLQTASLAWARHFCSHFACKQRLADVWYNMAATINQTTCKQIHVAFM